MNKNWGKFGKDKDTEEDIQDYYNQASWPIKDSISEDSN